MDAKSGIAALQAARNKKRNAAGNVANGLNGKSKSSSNAPTKGAIQRRIAKGNPIADSGTDDGDEDDQ